MKFEDIIVENPPTIGGHTAQIHNDFLYVHNTVNAYKENEKTSLLRFDISKRKSF